MPSLGHHRLVAVADRHRARVRPYRSLMHWMAGFTMLWLLAPPGMPWFDYGKTYRPVAQAICPGPARRCIAWHRARPSDRNWPLLLSSGLNRTGSARQRGWPGLQLAAGPSAMRRELAPPSSGLGQSGGQPPRRPAGKIPPLPRTRAKELAITTTDDASGGRRGEPFIRA